jgi:hypothetical protein
MGKGSRFSIRDRFMKDISKMGCVMDMEEVSLVLERCTKGNSKTI